MEIDLAALRRLAASATPGPWHAPGLAELHDIDDRVIGMFVDCEPVIESERPVPDVEEGDRNAAYIAAASPDVILALLDRLEKPEVTDAMVDAAVRAMRTSDISPHNVYGWMRAAIVAALGAR